MDWTTATESILQQGMSTFGTSVTYQPAVGASVIITGVFGNSFVEVDTGQGVTTSSLKPTLGIKLSDLAVKPSKYDKVTIGSTLYKVIESQEDGQGGSTLILGKV